MRQIPIGSFSRRRPPVLDSVLTLLPCSETLRYPAGLFRIFNIQASRTKRWAKCHWSWWITASGSIWHPQVVLPWVSYALLWLRHCTMKSNIVWRNLRGALLIRTGNIFPQSRIEQPTWHGHTPLSWARYDWTSNQDIHSSRRIGKYTDLYPIISNFSRTFANAKIWWLPFQQPFRLPYLQIHCGYKMSLR